MTKIDDYIETSKVIKNIDKNKRDYVIIHYSCESFYDKENVSSKISGIAIRHVDNSRTELFTPYIFAETLGYQPNEIVENYEEIEFHMLASYFVYVKRNQDKTWIHWNMRDRNYGFSAIEHRYQVLSRKFSNNNHDFYMIRQKDTIDLANLFVKRYGPNYASKPKLTTLYKKNNLDPKDILTGKEEAEYFEKNQFVKIGHSIASKVKVIDNYLTLAINNQLKVETSAFEIYGKTLKSYYYIFTSKCPGKVIIKFLAWIIPFLLGFFMEKLMDSFLF